MLHLNNIPICCLNFITAKFLLDFWNYIGSYESIQLHPIDSKWKLYGYGSKLLIIPIDGFQLNITILIWVIDGTLMA